MTDEERKHALSALAITNVASEGELGDARAEAFLKGYGAACEAKREEIATSFKTERASSAKLIETLKSIDLSLRIPAAEYVSAIGDVFSMIGKAIAKYEARDDLF